jgi:hypothetical protein
MKKIKAILADKITSRSLGQYGHYYEPRLGVLYDTYTDNNLTLKYTKLKSNKKTGEKGKVFLNYKLHFGSTLRSDGVYYYEEFKVLAEILKILMQKYTLYETHVDNLESFTIYLQNETTLDEKNTILYHLTNKTKKNNEIHNTLKYLFKHIVVNNEGIAKYKNELNDFIKKLDNLPLIPYTYRG